MIPKPSRRKQDLAPDQIFSAGFRDGMARRNHHPLFHQHPDYLRGYGEGYRFAHPQPLPATPEPKAPAPLLSFFEWADLNGALHSIRRWEEDQKRLGFGTVALGFRDGWWLVLISEDLHRAVLPF